MTLCEKCSAHQSPNYKKTNKNSLIIACGYFAIWAYVPLMYDDDVYSDSEYFWMSAAALIKYLAQTTSTWWITVWPRPVRSLGKKQIFWNIKQGWNDAIEIHGRVNTFAPVLTSHSGKLRTYNVGDHFFLFAFNSFHITLSVWVTGGRTFQGLSPLFHVRLSEFDWDPLSLQERGCSQVGCCCLPVLKVLCVCRPREKEKERWGVGSGGWGPYGPLPAWRLEDFTPFHLKNGNVTARYISPTIGIWASGLFISFPTILV